MSRLLLLLALLPCLNFGYSQTDTPPFVWTEAEPDGRLQVAYFRYELELSTKPTTAEIHLFADSRYQLLVNGNFVNFGPARFYPAHPMYDTYDLTPYLKTGENVIAVKVMSNGVSTFQLRRNLPAFVAWGTVTDGSQTYELATPGDWKCKASEKWDSNGPRMNFALGAMEIMDARKDIPGWEKADFDASAWQTPVALKDQEAWGPLTPRLIPHLTQQMYQPQEVTGIYSLRNEEDIYSFRVSVPDKSWEDFRNNRLLFGHTYIYSPVEQEVEVGLWWGNHFLNGKQLSQRTAGDNKPHRQQATLALEAGWNYFFVKNTSFWGKWDFFMAVPKNAGLILSPTKDKKSDAFFHTAGPFATEAEEKLEAAEVPFAPEELQAYTRVGWQPHSREADANNPAWDMGWRYVDETKSHERWKVDDIQVYDPNGTAIVYDFRFKKLGRIIIDYEAPEGTILDVAFTEELKNGMPHILKRVGLYMATRQIAAGGSERLETFKPYGVRYLQINVRNNDGPVTIKSVRIANQVYPFEQTGSFECSDPLFTQLWQLGWRTLQVCAEDSYTDTPYRERGLYAGDMLPQMGITLAGSGDLRLVKRSLELFQDMYIDRFNPGTPKHPDEIGLLEEYPLLSLEAWTWYVDRTEDMAFAKELYPAYKRLLNFDLNRRNEDGLVFNERVFVEWTQIQKSELYNTAYHNILARCCQLMARMAEKLGQEEDEKAFAKAYQELQQAIQTHFWDKDKQLFSDGIQADTLLDSYYPISSVMPYLAGVTTQNQHASIFDYITDTLQFIGTKERQRVTTPYGGFYVLGALYEQGLPAVAERHIRQNWSEMVFYHNDTAWENFGRNGMFTLSHAWSAAPTYYMTTQILGIELGWPKLADPDKLIIAPQVEDIHWAKGTVPHPKGLIKIHWEDKGDVLWMECEVPAGVSWDVQPKGKLAEKELWVNGVKYK